MPRNQQLESFVTNAAGVDRNGHRLPSREFDEVGTAFSAEADTEEDDETPSPCQDGVGGGENPPPAPPAPPAPFDGDPGAFPLTALHPIVRHLVEEIAMVYQVDPALPALCALGVIGGAAQNGWAILGAAGGHKTFANVYIAVAAPPAYGKSVASHLARPILDECLRMEADFAREQCPRLSAELITINASIERAKRFIANPRGGAGEVTPEDLTALLRRKDEIQLSLQTPTLWTGAATSAALVEVLKRNKSRTFSYALEAADVFRIAQGRFTKDGGGDLDLLLSGYSVEDWGESRVGRGHTKLKPCISGLWLCQPSIMEEVLGNPESCQRGLVARILGCVINPSWIPEDDGVVRGVNLDLMGCWESMITKIIQRRESGKHPEIITCGPEARVVFLGFHNEMVALRNSGHGTIHAQIMRAREHAIRIAVGLWLIDSFFTMPQEENRVLTRDQAERAVRLARWSIMSMAGLVLHAHRRSRADQVVQLRGILENEAGEMTLRDLDRHHALDRKTVEGLVADFPEHFRIEIRKPDTGRPSRVLCLVETNE